MEIGVVEFVIVSAILDGVIIAGAGSNVVLIKRFLKCF